MYLTLLSIAIAIAVGAGSAWFLEAGWVGSIVLGLVALVASWILGARFLNKRLAPVMQLVQKQVEAGLVQPALTTLEGILPMGSWMPLLRGQIYAQLGVLSFHAQQPERALDYLQKAGRRAAEAQMLLACIRYRAGDKDEAFRILDGTTPFNRKHVLLHNLQAWLLLKEGKRDNAIQVLNRLNAKQPNEASKDNLLRLQNGQKMNMKSFGVAWYALGFERPPATMGQMQTGRKGFRQPPKRKKK